MTNNNDNNTKKIKDFVDISTIIENVKNKQLKSKEQEEFDVFYHALEQYVAEFGNANVPCTYYCKNGYPLGQKVAYYIVKKHSIKQNARQKAFFDELTKPLDVLGFVWDYPNNPMDNFILHYIEFVRYNDGKRKIPMRTVCQDGYKLWSVSKNIDNAILAKQSGRAMTVFQLTDQDMDKLASVYYPIKEATQQSTLNKVKALNYANDEYYEQVGQIIDMLQNKHIPTAPEDFYKFYTKLKKYHQEHNDVMVPLGYVCKDGYALGIMVAHHRILQRSTITNPEHNKELHKLGFVWDYPTDPIDNFIMHFADYAYTHIGNTTIPQRYICADGYRLGIHAANIRSARTLMEQGRPAHIDLNDTRIQNLNAVHFPWVGKKTATKATQTVFQENFDLFYTKMSEYIQKYNNANVQSNYKCEDGYPLGANVEYYRQRKQRMAIVEKQNKALDKLGFNWHPTQNNEQATRENDNSNKKSHNAESNNENTMSK